MTPEQWKRVNELFHATQELTPDQQANFLQTQCADDEVVYAQVRALLDVDESAATHLETPALIREVEIIQQEQGVTPLPCQRLGHYEILAPLGSGGMGEVWLARDTRFSNQARVAIKTLPMHFTQDADRLKRFINEANATSALNHQNIIKIFDIGEETTEAGTLHFIATEYIEGITLRARMNQSEPIPITEALNIASQIAAALDAAHQAGIIHRDIKPENVMLQADGFVKVLDFGLAKLAPPTNGSRLVADTVSSAASADAHTLPGMLVGTLRYMSPEQARGITINRQTDLFSLGVVLYEMLTREPLFADENKSDVLAAILRKDVPSLSDSLEAPPAELERIVHKALAKNIRDRYQTARDLQIDLQELRQLLEMEKRLGSSGRHSGTQDQQLSFKPGLFSSLSWQLAWLLVPLALLLTGTIWWVKFRSSGQVNAPPPDSLDRFDVAKWQGSLGEVYCEGKFSPDGNWIAFTMSKGGTKNVWFKLISNSDKEGEPIPSTADEFQNEQPLWSPSGKELAYLSRRGGMLGIWRKTLSLGTPTLLKELPAEANEADLRHWSKSDVIYFESRGNLFAFTVGAKPITKLTAFDTSKPEVKFFSPSPDERWIAYTTRTSDGRSEILVVSKDGGQPKPIASFPSFVRNIAWHPDNQRLFFSVRNKGVYQIFVGDLVGTAPVQLTFGDSDHLVTDVSSDGHQILYGSSLEDSDVWGVKAKVQEFIVASDSDAELWPDTSPSQHRIAYQSVKGLNQGNNIDNGVIIVKSLSSPTTPNMVVANGSLPKWSPDGRHLAFIRFANNTYNLWVAPAEGGTEQQLTHDGCIEAQYAFTPYNLIQASFHSWSPDSQRLAYNKFENGRAELRVVNANGSNDIVVPSTDDPNLYVECPLWSLDGNRIAWSSRTIKSNAEGKRRFGLWITDVKAQTATQVYQADIPIRLLGWSLADESLIFASFASNLLNQPGTIKLSSISLKTKSLRQIIDLPLTYYLNIHLSSDRRTVAYVARQNEKDNLWLMPITGGMASKLTNNNDPHLYFSSLAWAPDNRTLYFGKQLRHNRLSVLANF